MKSRSLFGLIIILSALFLAHSGVQAASLSVTAPSAVILDYETGAILHSKSPHLQREPASTVKVLTALVVLDHLSLYEYITIPSSVEAVQPRKLYLRGGEKLRVIDLLRAALMHSANDAAAALAIVTAGSEWKFGRMMTEKAKTLGATQSNFIKASGLPAENQYSTVYDLALIMRAASTNSVINGILNTREISIRTAGGKTYYLKSHNKMLWKRRVIGKTGYTRKAGYCYVGVVEKGGQKAVISLLGSKKLWTDVTKLINAYTGSKYVSSASNELGYGSRGKEVSKIQKALKRAGFFRSRVTGYYGSLTQGAVKRFQKAKGLDPDGVAGPITKKYLAVYY